MSPVAVDAVAAGFVKGLTLKSAVGGTFHCCGPQAHTYDEILDFIGRALGQRKVRKLHHPALLVWPFIALFESFPVFPITRTQLTMLLEGNVCDPGPWAKTFDIVPLPFPEAIGAYLRP
jgi:NADH dehydrogenase